MSQVKIPQPPDAKRTAKNCQAIKDSIAKLEKHSWPGRFNLLYVEVVEMLVTAREGSRVSEQVVEWLGLPPLLVLALQAV